ncbi:MAG: hypothetical protein H0T51_26735 [Pirellulales bacterium]|nr:hypothetical protein [Pirellulales bacterium]
MPFRTYLVATAVLAFTPAIVGAHLPSPETRAIESVSGEFVLVLLTSVQDRAERREATADDPQQDGPLTEQDLREWDQRVARQKAIETRYPQSGLYRNEASAELTAELMWPSPFISMCREVFVADNGLHIVAAKGMDSTCWDGDADPLVFYSSGRKIAGYDAVTTLPCFWMRVVMAEWLRVYLPYDLASGIDDDASTFFIETNQGDRLTFDLATGALAGQRSPWPFYLAAPAVAVPFGFWISRRWLPGDHRVKISRRKSFSFSLWEILIVTALVAGTFTAARVWGWFGGACAVIATTGAVAARIRAGTSSAWLVGAFAALYAAYMTLVLCAIIDSDLLDGLTLLKLWLDEESSKLIPLGVLGTGAVAASWLAGGMCAANATAESI